MDECKCGIARADCEYHRPAPEPETQRSVDTYTHVVYNGYTYIRVYRNGRLIDEYPAD